MSKQGKMALIGLSGLLAGQLEKSFRVTPGITPKQGKGEAQDRREAARQEGIYSQQRRRTGDDFRLDQGGGLPAMPILDNRWWTWQAQASA